MMTPYRALSFIGAPITVEFDEPPQFIKTPGCPARFLWQERVFEIVQLLSQWDSFERRGRMASNMRPEHAVVAAKRGSWGVGRFYFRVRTADQRIFDLYYDRAPGKAGDREGSWYLFREMEASS